MQIGQPVPFGLDGFAKILLQAPVGGHVEQDRARIPDKTVGRVGNHKRADDAHDRVHEHPAE